MGYVHSYHDYRGATEIPEVRSISVPQTMLPISAEPVILAHVTVSETPIIEEIPMDMEGLGALIQGVEKRMVERFDAMDKRFEQVDRRFNAIDKRFDAVDSQFEKVDERFQSLDQKVGKVSDRAIHLQWMVGIAIILALVALGKQFWPLIDAVVPK